MVTVFQMGNQNAAIVYSKSVCLNFPMVISYKTFIFFGHQTQVVDDTFKCYFLANGWSGSRAYDCHFRGL